MNVLPQEIIARKRDGQPLTPGEIRAFVAGFADGSVSHAQAAAFAMAVYFRDMSRDESVALTEAMRDSGDVLDWSDLPGPTTDKHSTGGIGDNVSLMLAPILAACGVFVPMISGRGLGHSGGTLDKLDSIPGYMTAPDNDLFRRVVREAGCAIIGQTANLAPADKLLYAIRDVTATVESIPLITGSILSKKLAAGLGSLILDVKTGSGAFMPTLERARALADNLVAVANGAGLKTAALITDMNEPLATAAGNALEVRNAVDFLTGAHMDARLCDVTLALAAAALEMSGHKGDARAAVRTALTSGKALEHFAAMVTLLGGPADFVDHMDEHLTPAPIVRDVFAEGDGTIAEIDTREIGWAVVALGGGRRLPTDTVDHAVGFDRLLGLGATTGKGMPLARIHARDELTATEAEARLIAAYRLGDKPPMHPLIADRIDPLMPRVILCILDSFGIGGAPDAGTYSDGHGHPDTGADTLGHIAANYNLKLPNLDALGLGAAAKLSTGSIPRGLTDNPTGGRHGVGREVSKGKDTPSGHWEIAGVPVPFDWGYFPQSVPTFPPDLIATLIAEAKLPGILGDKHASGTAIIAELGEEHIRTGKPICYTSIDSVFQIAAHEIHFGLDRLYEVCEIAFRLTEPMKIGRVIARPFVGETSATFKRTGNRRDFAISPPAPTLLDRAKAAGRQVFAIGKISDIYAGHGVTHKIKASGNMVLFDRTLEAMEMAEDGAFIMTNFVDFDSEFGHRRDVPGYAGALEAFDARIPELIQKLRPDDLVVFTADHGNDPTWIGSDHTREQIPILAFSPALTTGTVGIRQTFADIGESIAHWLGLAPGDHGRSFL